MITTSSLFKKYFFIIIAVLTLIHGSFILYNLYIFINTLTKNTSSISAFINAFSINFEKDTYKRIDEAKAVFQTTAYTVKNNSTISTKEIKKIIKEKYNDYDIDVAYINAKGIIYDTTANELGLNLWDIPDARFSLIEAKSKGNLLVDFPVQSGEGKYYLYLLQYIPEKDIYLQIGFILDILNDLVATLLPTDKIDGYDYSLDICFTVKEEKEGIKRYNVYCVDHKEQFKKSQNKQTVQHIKYYKNQYFSNVVENMFKENKLNHIKSNWLGFEIYRVISNSSYGNNPAYSILYNISVYPYFSKLYILSFLFVNLFFILLYYFTYLFFYKKIDQHLVSPLNKLSTLVIASNPVLENDIKTDIEELNNLKEAYGKHYDNIRLKDFIKELITVQEHERERISRDLHDSVVQDLNYILIKLKSNKEQELAEILKNKIAEIRTLISENDISSLKIIGLTSYIEGMVIEYSKKYPDIIFELNKDAENTLNLDISISINIIRVLQEIINNSLLHSECSKINFSLIINSDILQLSIKDNGKGFDIDSAIHKRNHFGLINIRERVYIIGGSLDIESNKNGTKYTITLKLS